MIRTLTIEQKNELIEKLAELEHDQWIVWSKSLTRMENLSDKRLVRWAKLWKPYAQLTDEQKEQDRVRARKSIKLIKELNLEILSK